MSEINPFIKKQIDSLAALDLSTAQGKETASQIKTWIKNKATSQELKYLAKTHHIKVTGQAPNKGLIIANRRSSPIFKNTAIGLGSIKALNSLKYQANNPLSIEQAI